MPRTPLSARWKLTKASAFMFFALTVGLLAASLTNSHGAIARSTPPEAGQAIAAHGS